MIYSHLVRKILALNVAGSRGLFASWLRLQIGHPARCRTRFPHAMVLTGIVVAVSATALALALACRIHQVSRNRAINRK